MNNNTQIPNSWYSINVKLLLQFDRMLVAIKEKSSRQNKSLGLGKSVSFNTHTELSNSYNSEIRHEVHFQDTESEGTTKMAGYRQDSLRLNIETGFFFFSPRQGFTV